MVFMVFYHLNKHHHKITIFAAGTPLQVLQVSLEQTSLTQGERLRCGQATAKVMGKSSRREGPHTL